MRLCRLLRSQRHRMTRSCQRAPFKWVFCLGCLLFIGLKMLITTRTQADHSWDQPTVGRHVKINVQGDLVNKATVAHFNISVWNEVNRAMERKYAAMETEHKKLKKLSQHMAEVRQAGGIMQYNKKHRKPQPAPRIDTPVVVRNISMFEPPWLRDRSKFRQRGKRH